MRHLTTVRGSFHGRVLAARLGAEGILVQLRGIAEGPYPIQGAVEVFVESDQLERAREVLLGDAVDDAVDEWAVIADHDQEGTSTLPGPASRRSRRLGKTAAIVALVLVAVLVVVGIVNGLR